MRRRSENELKRGLISALRAGLSGSVVFAHSERLGVGVPDVSVTWSGFTTWLELKIRPRWSSGLQEYVICRLARHGRCWIVLYDQRAGLTAIVRPAYLSRFSDGHGTAATCDGVDHDLVVSFVRGSHGCDESALRVSGPERDPGLEGSPEVGGDAKRAERVPDCESDPGGGSE